MSIQTNTEVKVAKTKASKKDNPPKKQTKKSTASTKKVSKRLTDAVAKEVAEDVVDTITAEVTEKVTANIEEKAAAKRKATAEKAAATRKANKDKKEQETVQTIGSGDFGIHFNTDAHINAIPHSIPAPIPHVPFKVQLDEGAEVPTRAHATDTGYDIKIKSIEFVYEETPLYKRLLGAPKRMIKTVKCDTGVHVQPCRGFWTLAVPNSRLAKLPFVLGNSVGIIDNGYTGSIRYIFNVLPYATEEEIASYFKVGNVVGQLIPMPLTLIDFTVVDKLEDTDRGDGGFGSTAEVTK